MITTPKQLSVNQQTWLDSSFAAMTCVFDSLQRLVALNFNTAHTQFDHVSASALAVWDASSRENLLQLQGSLAQQCFRTLLNYCHSNYDIISQGMENTTRSLDIQLSTANRYTARKFEKAAESVPIGSGGAAAAAAIKSGITATNDAYDRVSKATKKAADIAESNVTAATDAAIKVAKIVGKKKSAS